ncbi:hypothetical protein DQ238_00340 [Geodermatophilus sp. TF02-6]|nr:hypothetical protein DQ238_00340 [Geodermatophilus sp. TF02-6]
MIAHAVDHGLLTTRPSPSDARRRLVRLTPAGLALLEAAHQWQDAIFTALTQDWTASERSPPCHDPAAHELLRPDAGQLSGAATARTRAPSQVAAGLLDLAPTRDTRLLVERRRADPPGTDLVLTGEQERAHAGDRFPGSVLRRGRAGRSPVAVRPGMSTAATGGRPEAGVGVGEGAGRAVSLLRTPAGGADSQARRRRWEARWPERRSPPTEACGWARPARGGCC